MNTEVFNRLKQLLEKRLTGETVATDKGFNADTALLQVGLSSEDLEREEPIHLLLLVDAQPLLDEQGDIYWQFEILGPEES